MKPIIQEGDFWEVINQAILEKRHVAYLRRAIKDYEDYKREFNNNFSQANPADAIYTFRADYLLKKPVWREIEILGHQTFEDFADIIIDSMGWVNDHMHGFSFPQKDAHNRRMYTLDYTFYAPGWEDDPHPTFKSNQIRICDIDYGKQPRLRFMFDFGDGHEFDIDFKSIRKTNEKKKIRDFPCLTDERGVAPEQYPRL